VTSTELREFTEGGRVPPQDLDAERSVLGAMLLDSAAVGRALEILDETAFYRLAHRRIFRAMVSLWEKTEAVDLITVGDALRKQGDFDSSGGATYLASLLNSVATASSVEYHAKVVKEKSLLRSIIEVCTMVASRAYEDTGDAGNLLDQAERAIFAVSDNRLRKGFIRAKEMINPTIKAIEKLYEEKKPVTGLETGFVDFDHMTSGLQGGDMVIIAGRPSMGKTSLAMNMAANIAIRQKKGVGVFSLEMGIEALLMRLLCSEARVSAHRLRTGYLRESEWPLLISAAGHLAEAPLYIDDTGGMNVLELRAKARRLSAEVDLGLIVVDYLQLLSGGGTGSRSENRQQEISEISRSLKALAKELKVPVLALSQLSRAVEARTDHRPMLSDLRESGAIEQDADVVCFVYREEHYKRTDENEGMGEIIIGKQRNGPVGVVKIAFIGEYTRFENLSREQEEPF